MSRRDTYHDACKTALIRDGWTITHDPLPIIYGGTALSTDLGAEKSIENKNQIIAVEFIAVEVKDFDSKGAMSNFEKALGQFRLYKSLLKRNDPDRILFLAIRQETYETFFQLPVIQAVMEDDDIRLIVFNEHQGEIVLWKK